MVLPTYSARLSQHAFELDANGDHALGWVSPCRVASTANLASINTQLNAGDTLDGVTLVAGDRVLLKNQSTPAQNGIYIVGPNPVQRADDFVREEQMSKAVVAVLEGSQSGRYECDNNGVGGFTLGSSSITFSDFGGGGAAPLEDVLFAGAETGGYEIYSDTGYPARTDVVSAQLNIGAPNVELYGGTIGDGEYGGYIDLQSGSGDYDGGGGAGPVDIFLDGGHDDGTGGSLWVTTGNAKAGTDTDGGDMLFTAGDGDGLGRHGLFIIDLDSLPTSDPGVLGALYRDGSGNLKVSI